MKTLNRKLWRDILKTKGQVLAIVLVIISGISTFIMLRSTMISLNLTQMKFYQDYGFADVFASLKRAPESLKNRVAEIPGVAYVETRVIADVKISVEGFDEPVTGRLVSVPEDSESLLNRLYIVKGRMVDPWKDDEAVVNEAFADAHHFSPGDRFSAVINGRWKTFTIVGTALCPEFVLAIRPGGLSPDFKRYAIIWTGRPSLETAYNMKGAFNNVVLSLSPHADTDDVITRLDDLLEWYGGLGSYSRKDQTSHRFLSEEFKQLDTSARIFPAIFIAVATFLLQVVISRTVSTQREQIACLKAFGYNSIDIACHYVKSILLITFAGILGGIIVGMWFGKKLGAVYMEFYRFPYFMYELRPSVVVTAVLISIATGLAGTLYSVWKASNLPPAVAMRPEPPARYRRSVMEHLGFWKMLSQSTRIIVRNIERRPVRSLLSIIGISLACGAVITATFFTGAIDYMVDTQFRRSQKQDMTISFVEPTSYKAIYELHGLEGIQYAEAFRSVPVRLRHEQRSYRTSIQGIERGARLNLLLDSELKYVDVPPQGILLTDYLGQLLGVKPGDMLTVEVLEGARPVRSIPVAGLFEQSIGIAGYMDINALNAIMREGQAISGAYLTVDSNHEGKIYNAMLKMPRVAGTLVRRDEIQSFYDTQAEVILFFTLIASILGATIAFGVVYNNARISLSERSRELASLRVLGYTRAEISFIFLGELAFITLIAIPVGFLIGRGMSAYLAAAIGSDLFRVPLVIEPGTYSLAAIVVLISACISGYIVRHRLDHLDLVAVLKTKE